MTGAREVMARCDELAGHSSLEGGIERVYLSPQHAAVNRVAGEWMRQAGMRTWQDAAGSLCGRVEGERPGLPALVLGSHLDSVTDAGRYDGILGVLSAVAVVQRLVESGRAERLPFALEVVAFADEEGTRFGATLLGSRAFAGEWNADWFDLAGTDGVPMRDAFRSFGLEPERIADAARRPEELVGYLELHIEQGPRLEDAGRALGVVSAISAATRFSLELVGEARHCATPYERRRDALTGAAEAIVAIERMSRDAGTPATVGRISVEPGGVNVIPGAARFSLDLRAESQERRDDSWRAILAELESIAGRRGLELSHEVTHSAPEVPCAPRLKAAVAAGIEAAGESRPPELLSIAGHDAMAVASVTDVGMLFVRCAGGISHSADESVTEADVAAGLDAFEAAVLALAAER